MKTVLPGRSKAVILVKAAPRVGETHGETVCCAGIGEDGKWVRLYPVVFRTLDDAQKFRRWDIVEYDWSLPKGDARLESRRVEHQSIKIVSSLSNKHKKDLVAEHVVTGLSQAHAKKQSLALLRPKSPRFLIEKKDRDLFLAETKRFKAWHQHETDSLFGFMQKAAVPYEPAPYSFKYQYQCDDGVREGTCQDWEVEATFLSWRRRYTETQALEFMETRFGEEYPEKGFVLAMGTHKAYPQWLINGVIRLDHGSEDYVQKKLF